MRTLATAVLITALSASAAFGADGPLAPGKPAGMEQARNQNARTMLVVAGVALVGIAVGLAVSSNGNNATPTRGERLSDGHQDGCYNAVANRAR